MIGRVKFFSVEKGCGIAPPLPGACLCFDVVPGTAGKRAAANVVLIDEPDPERGDDPRRRAERVWTHRGQDEV
jgi:cold shock CspA family protein